MGHAGPTSNTFGATALAPSSCRSPSDARSTTIGSVLVGAASTAAATSLADTAEVLSVSRKGHEATTDASTVAIGGPTAMRNGRPCLFFARRSSRGSPTAKVGGTGGARPYGATTMLAITSHGPDGGGRLSGRAMAAVTKLRVATGLAISTTCGHAVVRVAVVATSRSGLASKGLMAATIMAKSTGGLAAANSMSASRLPP